MLYTLRGSWVEATSPLGLGATSQGLAPVTNMCVVFVLVPPWHTAPKTLGIS